MNVVVIGQHTFRGPASWDELTPRHFLQLLNWRVKLGGEPAGRWVLLQLWYGIRYRHTRLLDDDQRAWLISYLDFLDERPERWMLPCLRVRLRRYIGPGDGLQHLTFAEFMHAEAARKRYEADGQPADLAELVAALYRPKARFFETAGDGARTLFDRRTLDTQTADMATLPGAVQLGVLMNYMGCLDRFPDQFEYLFKPSDQGGQEGGSWLDVGISLARQTGALGTFAQLEQSNLYLVLTMLDALMKENEQLKAKLQHGTD
ncbi:hypothetical protein [Spirosoma sordidisoli]|uniref:Uncharacterized protein n=1 Tax=Spirosoma sordidisoli TaxID=2502893 RepID=A0A4V1RWC1_9BACT|nr:hypothetical protein [Spirosoma sordidisoli]RYC69748.1 hypothetical protein EQG79_14225 [Spirosoma sordidisoli]